MDKNVIAMRLRNLRKDKSIREVAKDINISASALAMYETGKRIPKDSIKLLLAKYYNTSVEALFFANIGHDL